MYRIYGNDLSYFTRKLEAAFRFYGTDFALVDKRTGGRAEEIEQRAGTHQVPVLHTPENWMIADSTPLMQLMDSRLPKRRMFPAGPPGILVQVVEEYFDEWIARTMVHYRWHYEESAGTAALRITGGDEQAARQVAQWGRRACRATGTESERQQEAAEAEYQRLLEAMEKQLGETRFLLGDRPTAVDCIVLGGLRAHTNNDPDPKKLVARFPRVVRWAESEADRDEPWGELAPFPDSTPFARTVLGEMSATYRPFVLGNRGARENGDKAFRADIHGESVSYLARSYPECSRQMIVDRIRCQLDDAARRKVNAWLASVGLEDCFGS
ncbi:MAG TPA: glutathione S-transferase family protein [Gammaproteobacteria bacterium]|nr:glutathione S-transferase family protein [Gammaproteobacteria bacterium]